MKPDFKYESQFWRKGFGLIIGIDEVGRGCFAGPVVASAVVWPQPLKLKIIESLGIDDSKKLKPKERERLAKEIKKYALAWDVTEVGVSVINRIGIGRATQKAMRKAVRDIVRLNRKKRDINQHNNITIQQYSNVFILVDGFHIKYLRGLGLRNQKAIKHGDQKSISIAAASILAKVYRDKLMRRLSKKYPRYGWGRNKGYGTREHQKSILRYGLTCYHRKQFVKTWKEKLVLFKFRTFFVESCSSAVTTVLLKF